MSQFLRLRLLSLALTVQAVILETVTFEAASCNAVTEGCAWAVSNAVSRTTGLDVIFGAGTYNFTETAWIQNASSLVLRGEEGAVISGWGLVGAFHFENVHTLTPLELDAQLPPLILEARLAHHAP